jgi:nucleoside-diphosphate-sugar epimerase
MEIRRSVAPHRYTISWYRPLESTLRPLGIQPPLTQRRLDFFTKSFWFSTAKYRQVLGFVPRVSFAVGAGATAEWYRKQGYL